MPHFVIAHFHNYYAILVAALHDHPDLPITDSRLSMTNCMFHHVIPQLMFCPSPHTHLTSKPNVSSDNKELLKWYPMQSNKRNAI
jgi:hypothetical protein